MLLIGCFFCIHTDGQTPNKFPINTPIVVIDSPVKTLDLSPSLEINTENTAELDAILNSSHFTPFATFKGNYQIPHYYWFRFKVVSTYADTANPYYLSLKKTESLGGYDYINAFIIQEGEVKQLKTGRLVNFQDRTDKDFKFSLPLFLNKNDSATVYFCVHQVHKPFIRLEPQLVPKRMLKNDYRELADKFTTINYVIVGDFVILFFVLLLNLLFYLFDRNTVYLYYSTFLFFLIIRLSTGYLDFGHPYWVSIFGSWINYYDLICSVAYLGVWGYLKTANILLNLEESYPKFYKILHYFCCFLILFVDAQNKAGTYQFTDIKPLPISYYRLRQIDNDGKEDLSKIISISNKGSNKLKVYPSVTNQFLAIETDATADFEVINFLGRVVMSGKIAQRIDVSVLPQGVYLLRIGLEAVKFVKE